MNLHNLQTNNYNVVNFSVFMLFISFFTLLFNIMDFKNFDIFVDGGKNNLNDLRICLKLRVVAFLICSVISTWTCLNLNQDFQFVSFLSVFFTLFFKKDFRNFNIFADGGEDRYLENGLSILSEIFMGCTISYLQCKEHRNFFKL